MVRAADVDVPGRPSGAVELDGALGESGTQLVGTLVIDMADAKKNQLVWRGMGVKEVNTQAKPEKRDKSINEAVKKIFKNYPPKQKS